MVLAVSSFPTKAQGSIQFPDLTADMQRSSSKSSIRSFVRQQERNTSPSSLPLVSSSSCHQHSLSAPMNSSSGKSTSGRVTFDDRTPASASSQSRSCCRRCGRQVPPGGKRNAVASTTSPKSHSIDGVTRDVVAQPLPRNIAESVNGRNNRATTASPPVVPPQADPVIRPVSAFSDKSDLVERTKGIMASLAPAHDTASIRSLPPQVKRAPATATFPKTVRSNPIPLFLSASLPKLWDYRGKNTYPPLHKLHSSTNLPDELGVRRESPLPRIASPISLSAGHISSPLPLELEVDTTSLSSAVLRQPLYLDLPLSDKASVFSMSEFLGSIFNEESSPESKLDAHEEFSKSDSDLLEQQSPLEYPSEPTTPMVFTEHDRNGMEDTVSARYLGNKYKSWNARARRGSRKLGKLTVRWTPPASSGGPEDPLEAENTEKSQLDEQSSNTASSIDEMLPPKPLTYLIHHKNTSSVDVSCSSDHQDRKKISSTSEEDEKSIEESQVPEEEGVIVTRTRKPVWQESAVLEVIPRLRELRLTKNWR